MSESTYALDEAETDGEEHPDISLNGIAAYFEFESFEKMYAALHAQAVRYVGKKKQDVADDVVQSIIQSMLRFPHTFLSVRNAKNKKSFLMQTIYHTSMRESYGRQRKRTVHSIQRLDYDTGKGFKIEEVRDHRESSYDTDLLDLMRQSIAALENSDYREVLEMRAEGYQYDAIAEQKGIKLGTVCTRCMRGCRAARQKMEETLGDLNDVAFSFHESDYWPRIEEAYQKKVS